MTHGRFGRCVRHHCHLHRGSSYVTHPKSKHTILLPLSLKWCSNNCSNLLPPAYLLNIKLSRPLYWVWMPLPFALLTWICLSDHPAHSKFFPWKLSGFSPRNAEFLNQLQKPSDRHPAKPFHPGKWVLLRYYGWPFIERRQLGYSVFLSCTCTRKTLDWGEKRRGRIIGTPK